MSALLALAVVLLADECFLREGLVNAFEHQWYCREGNAAGLRPLEGDPAYRFILIASFRPTRAVTIRLANGSATAEGVVVSGRAGYDPRRIARSTRKSISVEDWRLLEQRLENAGVWEAPDQRMPEGVDGAQWLMEGRKNGKTFFRDVFTPSDSTHPQYRKAALFMLQLADIGLEVEEP